MIREGNIQTEMWKKAPYLREKPSKEYLSKIQGNFRPNKKSKLKQGNQSASPFYSSCSTFGTRLLAKKTVSIEGTIKSIELNQETGNKWVFVGLVFTNYGNKTFMLEIECLNDKYTVSNAKAL